MVDAALSLADAYEEEATEDEAAVDVAVLVAEPIFGMVDATDAAVVLDAEVAADSSSVLEALLKYPGGERWLKRQTCLRLSRWRP